MRTQRNGRSPRHAARSAYRNVPTAISTAATPSAPAPVVPNPSRPSARAVAANGPQARYPGGWRGVNGEAGIDGTSDIASTPTIEPVTAIVREAFREDRASVGRIAAEPSSGLIGARSRLSGMEPR